MMLEDFLFNVIFFLFAFLMVFLVDYFILSKVKKGKKRVDKLTTIDSFLIRRYNLDEKKLNLTRLNFQVALINSFIISFVSSIICLINVFITIQFLIGFVMLFFLTYAIYEIYGRHLRKKYGKTNKID